MRAKYIKVNRNKQQSPKTKKKKKKNHLKKHLTDKPYKRAETLKKKKKKTHTHTHKTINYN